MLELLIGPAKKLLEMGIETFKKSEDMRTLTVVVQDKILRETRFNLEVFQQIVKRDKEGAFINSEEVRLALIKALRTTAFDELNNETIPVSLFFPYPVDKGKWPKDSRTWGKIEKYLEYTESVRTQADLLERLYHRLFLIKTFAECGKLQGDLNYICFLLMALLKSLKGVQLEAPCI